MGNNADLAIEADILSGIPRDGKQNRYESRERKRFNREWAGPEIIMIPNFTHKYTFYINKL